MSPSHFQQPSCARRRIPVGIAALTLWLHVVQGVAVSAGEVDVGAVNLDGTRRQAAWLGSSDGSTVRLGGADGEVSLPLNGFSLIEFAADPVEPEFEQVTYFAGAGAVFSRIEAFDGKDLIISSVLGRQTPVALKTVSAIQLGDAESAAEAHALLVHWLARREPGKDILITRSGGESGPKALKGRLESLDAAGGTFEFGGRVRTFSVDKAYAVVLAEGTRRAPEFPVRIVLSDGSALAGQLLSADRDNVHFQPPWGGKLSLRVTQIISMEIKSDRIVYVSDLAPVDAQSSGIVHEEWPYRMDQSVTMGPIQIDGTHYEKGIGCHSRSELTFRLDEPFESLVGTLGIDDRVRPRGSVVYRVVGDGRVLFESGDVTGHDAPRRMVVDVHGVELLKLIVDFGEALDLSDHADWAELKLIRPNRTHGDPT